MSLFVSPAFRATDANGVLPGATWTFYTTGTTTPATVYTTSARNVAHTNPVVADAAGLFPPIYIDPAVTYRAILKNAVGTVIQDIDPIDDAFAVSLAASSGAALVGAIRSEAGAVARTVQDKLRDVVSVKDFGAVGDGVTDDRAAIAAAVAGARGKRIIFPEGNYLINTDGGTITLEEVSLEGQGVLDGATGSIDQGVNLLITGTTNGPFKVRRGTSIRGMGFFYPNQADSATPTVYATTLTFDFTNGAVQFVTIADCVVYNAYKFLDMDNGSTGAIGHVNIFNNFICALNRAIYLRYNAEHLRIERNNFTFGHWLAATEAGARSYMRANATVFQVDQSDGVEFTDNLVFGHLNGVLSSATSLCQFMNIFGNKFDDVRYGIKATGSGRFDGIIGGNTFNSYNSQNTALQGRSVSIETTGTGLEGITFVWNNFDLSTEDHIYTSGANPTRKMVIGPNNYRSWASGKSSGSYGAINATGNNTNVQVTGGWFYGSNNTAYSSGILGTMNTLQVVGATFDGCQAAINVSASIVTTSGNRSFATGGTTSNLVSATDIKASGNAWDKSASVTPAISVATYTVTPTDAAISFSAACTVTLPSAATYSGREIMLKTTGANAIISASSNVVGLTGGAAGTAILAATAGKWARLVADGTSWQIMAAN